MLRRLAPAEALRIILAKTLLPSSLRRCLRLASEDLATVLAHRVEFLIRIQIFSHAQLRGRANQKSRSEEHTSELQSLMRISYAVFCLNKKNIGTDKNYNTTQYIIITTTLSYIKYTY